MRRQDGGVPSHTIWRRPGRISRILRISAKPGKALEPRRDGKTAHNRHLPRYLAIISRRLAPLNEKWGKSSITSIDETAKPLV
jgi:hypothetical protein